MTHHDRLLGRGLERKDSNDGGRVDPGVLPVETK